MKVKDFKAALENVIANLNQMNDEGEVEVSLFNLFEGHTKIDVEDIRVVPSYDEKAYVDIYTKCEE